VSGEAPELRVLAELLPFAEVERVWLFGSRARGDARPRSDIDLAIAAPAADARRWQAILDAIEDAPTLLRVDVTRMEEAPEELRAEILRSGRVIHER
jgi:predicted nucleotidyltransferase